MNPNEIRSSHPSSAQVETLVEFMERNPGMAKGFMRTQNARERSRRQWEELAVRLNSIGGTIKSYKQWTKENDTPSPSHEVQRIQDADTDNIHVPQQQRSQAPTEESPAIVFYDSTLVEDQEHTPPAPPVHAISRQLFASSSSSTVGTSQSILRNNQLEHTPPPNPHIYHPSLSPPTVTLSHTPTPSPSRRGSTQVVASPVIHRTATSSSSRHAASVASPSRRSRTIRGSRGGSVSSRHTSSVAAPPPSQRRTEFSTTTERFLRVEEQQLEIQRLNTQILQSFLESSAQRDRILAEAVTAVGKGLQALAEAKDRDRV